jgi:hypothetical protein
LSPYEITFLSDAKFLLLGGKKDDVVAESLK